MPLHIVIDARRVRDFDIDRAARHLEALYAEILVR